MNPFYIPIETLFTTAYCYITKNRPPFSVYPNVIVFSNFDFDPDVAHATNPVTAPLIHPIKTSLTALLLN
jgi:hypothetical protein